MKKTVFLALVAALVLSPLASVAQATEPAHKDTAVIAGQRRRPAPPPPAPRRSGPSHGYNSRRDDHRRDDRRHRSKGSSTGAAIAGGIIGGLILGTILSDNHDRRPEPPRQPVLVCDQYGNCWYQ